MILILSLQGMDGADEGFRDEALSGVYVDQLMHHGWRLRGRRVRNCHMFARPDALDELHRVARAAGLKREWFQADHRVPHYDLTPSRRAAAIRAGAMSVSSREAVALWRRYYPR